MDIIRIRENKILSLCFDFSLLVIEYCEKLNAQKKYAISRQLLRSATAVGAYAIEAQHAESKSDFIHKFKIAIKEGEEAEYWLLLCKYSKGFPEPDFLLEMIGNIHGIIGRIIHTSKLKKDSTP
jgi:four helix bundle protein